MYMGSAKFTIFLSGNSVDAIHLRCDDVILGVLEMLLILVVICNSNVYLP